MMDNFKNLIDNFNDQIPNGVKSKLNEYLGKYSKDSNNLLWFIAGLIVVYFVLKMIMPMVQNVIVLVIIALVGWVSMQKMGYVKT